MIEVRLTQNDPSTWRYFKAVRDGAVEFLTSVSVRLRLSDGTVKTGSANIENQGEGTFKVEFGAGGLDLSVAGEAWLEFVVNGEHGHDPIECWIRPEFKRGPE